LSFFCLFFLKNSFLTKPVAAVEKWRRAAFVNCRKAFAAQRKCREAAAGIAAASSAGDTAERPARNDMGRYVAALIQTFW
jgi:hypothetical protein